MIGEELLSFKTERIKAEWDSPSMNQLLKKIVIDVAAKRWEMLRNKTVVTCIYRDKQENADALSTSQTHCEWRAVDLRVNGSSKNAEEFIREKVNKTWDTGLKNMPRVPPLDHGTAPHYHVQITRKEARS